MNFSSLQLPEIYSIQDQQNQTLNQHDCRHPRDGEQQGFPRLVVIGKPLDFHVQCPIKNFGCRDLAGAGGLRGCRGHGVKY